MNTNETFKVGIYLRLSNEDIRDNDNKKDDEKLIGFSVREWKDKDRTDALAEVADKLVEAEEIIDELKAKDRYPYRSDLILMLKSVMLAHGIIEEGVFDFDYENGELDKYWVQLISGVAGRQFRNRTLIRRPVYGPIYKKIISWIAYEENKPITEYNYEKEKSFSNNNNLNSDCYRRCAFMEQSLSDDIKRRGIRLHCSRHSFGDATFLRRQKR